MPKSFRPRKIVFQPGDLFVAERRQGPDGNPNADSFRITQQAVNKVYALTGQMTLEEQKLLQQRSAAVK